MVGKLCFSIASLGEPLESLQYRVDGRCWCFHGEANRHPPVSAMALVSSTANRVSATRSYVAQVTSLQ